ncbi:endonuclease domain-containing protein [Leucobacter chromiireducens]|uniref:endonuclease domain-containing protein n=1 Tax=Leucobacter chromiireducens TaxID=283877 RepID=UPI000F63F0B2|nr:hypothetical protein [Leucobacter chromiireducens]
MTERSPIRARPEAYQVAELRAGGVSRSRLRGADVRRIGRGIVLHPGARYDHGSARDRTIAVGQALSKEFFVSRRSAALLWGMPSPPPANGRVEVGSFSPLRAPRRPSVQGHRVKSGVLHWSRRAELTVPTAEDVWCQLAAVVPLSTLIVVGDFLISGNWVPVGRTPPLSTLATLEAATRRHRGTTGAPARRAALPRLRTPVDSPPETELRLLIEDAGFPEPRVNCPIQLGSSTLHADLGYPEQRVAIEYEGAHHFQDPGQVRRDLERIERMSAAGWQVLRATARTLRDPTQFLRGLALALSRAAG